ncbi:hypothetical protein GOP47_0027176 [Adiantum capillus-veneris]|nr:hypothetical protein GOP47_0027176 [Adiantum capillus-veneris]
MASKVKSIAGLFEAQKRQKMDTVASQNSRGGSEVPDQEPARKTDPTEEAEICEFQENRNPDGAPTNPGVKEELSQEQRMRMELNKAAANAIRNVKVCEEMATETKAQGLLYPEFKSLLVEPGWSEVLSSELGKAYIAKLFQFVKEEAAAGFPIYPPPANIFNAFNTCPFDKVKVVILGQDPYHGPGQAMGLCFSVQKGIRFPPSLLNIFKEIQDDVGCTIPSHGNLDKWSHQGVLLLNTVLTVRGGKANSHAKKGWEEFTDAAIKAVASRRSGVVFLLWGNSAQEKIRLINQNTHHVLKAAHPSGLSAHKGFFKCRHFSETNRILEKQSLLPIDWQI